MDPDDQLAELKAAWEAFKRNHRTEDTLPLMLGVDSKTHKPILGIMLKVGVITKGGWDHPVEWWCNAKAAAKLIGTLATILDADTTDTEKAL